MENDIAKKWIQEVVRELLKTEYGLVPTITNVAIPITEETAITQEKPDAV